MRRREQNTTDGGAVLAGLVDLGVTYRDIEAETGIPRTTAQRWATPPKRADSDQQDEG